MADRRSVALEAHRAVDVALRDLSRLAAAMVREGAGHDARDAFVDVLAALVDVNVLIDELEVAPL